MLDGQLFGSMLTFIIVGAVFYLLTFGLKRNLKNLKNEERLTVEKYCCVTIATGLYFLIVSLSSVYIVPRYMMPIYAVLFVLILCLLSAWIKKILAAHYLYGMIFIMTIICVNGLKNADWSILNRSSEALLNAAREHGEANCLFIYDNNNNNSRWRLYPAYFEISQYHSVTFLEKENLETLDSMDLALQHELVVTLDGEDLEIINKIMNVCPFLNTYKQLGKYSTTTSYYLYGE